MDTRAASASQFSSWRDAVRRGRQWLAAEINARPPLHQAQADLNWYSKIPWALAGSGDRANAIKALRRCDSLAAPAQTDWTNAPSYALGWLVAGARAAEQFDVARVLYAKLQPYICPTSGLIKGTLEPREQWFDASIQGAILHAAVAIGDLPTARRAGQSITRYIDDQPDADAIYTHFHPGRGFATHLGADDAIGRFVFRRGAQRQALANLGFVLQGLSRLSDASGDGSFAAASGRLMDRILRNHREDLLTHSQNHKVGYAALLLRRQLPGRDDLLEVAIAIARCITDRMQPDGRSLADVLFRDISQQPHYASVRTTCDSVLWLSGICDEFAAMS